MRLVRARAFTVLVGAALAAASLVAGAPPGAASPVPWNWLTVKVPFTAAADAVTTGTAQCPADWVPISGGVAPNGSANQSYETWTINQYVVDGDLVSGGTFQTTVQTSAGSSRSLVEIVNCIPAAQLPSYTKVTAVLSVNPALANNHAEGTVSCPANTVAVDGGVDWDNFTTRRVEFSGPTAGGDGWYAIGTDSVNTAHLYVEAYCLDINDVPGLQLAQIEYHNTGSNSAAVESIATCPAGTRVLSGGTEVHFWGSSNFPGYTFASWSTLNAWHATSYGGTPEYVYLRALCVPAGSPTISIDQATPGSDGTQTQSTDAVFSMSGSDPAGSTVSFHCALDTAALGICSSAPGYSNLTDGTHTFSAYTQTVDNRTSSLATYHWTVDTTAPTVTLKPLSRVMLGSTARQSWSGSDAVTGVESYAARYRRGAYNAALGPWVEPSSWAHLTSTAVSKALALGDTVCFSVRAVDHIGNQSSWSPQHCTTRPLDDRALSRTTSGWKRITGTAYWLKTATQSSTRYARLSRTGAVLNRVGIVATRCGTCGQVAIYVGSVKIGLIDLHRSKTQNRAVLLLPAFSGRTGKVTVRVVSTGKRVAIDGLVVAKSG